MQEQMIETRHLQPNHSRPQILEVRKVLEENYLQHALTIQDASSYWI